LIGADNNATSRRKEGKAAWEETKEVAKKKVDAGLLQEMNLVDWAQASNEQHAKRLSEHTVLKQTTIYEVSTKLKPANSVRVSFAKSEYSNTLPAKRTSGGKPVQGHGPVAVN
jgi:hypothetical protein